MRFAFVSVFLFIVVALFVRAYVDDIIELGW